MPQSIKLENLRDLVNMGVVKTATILGQKGGYAVLATLGTQDRTLVNKVGEVKMFATTDTAVRELTRLGLSSFLLDTSGYEAGLLRAPRKDVSERAKAATQALAYDQWVREQADEALAEEENGTARWHSHNDVWEEVLAETAQLVTDRDSKPKAKVAAATVKPTTHKQVQTPAHNVRRATAAKKAR